MSNIPGIEISTEVTWCCVARQKISQHQAPVSEAGYPPLFISTISQDYFDSINHGSSEVQKGNVGFFPIVYITAYPVAPQTKVSSPGFIKNVSPLDPRCNSQN